MTELRAALLRLLRSAEMARAYTIAVLSAAFGAHAVEGMSSRVTLITIVILLCVLGIAILVARREEITFLRLAPFSLLAFLIWALLSSLWSSSPTRTLVAWSSLLGFAIMAIVVGHIRDTLQTVRALGDTLRGILALSLAVEILSGILLDVPIPFLGVEGNIAIGGPIQGLFGTRNMLGFVTVIAMITFVIEWRTQSVSPPVAVPSIALAGFLALLSASPTVIVLAAVVGTVTAALTIVRHTPARNRTAVQWTLGGLVAAALALALYFRHPIIAWMGAGSDFSTRATLWNLILEVVSRRQIIGWGWFGPWDTTQFPFRYIDYALRDSHQTALNAYFDTLLQLGVAGLLLFLVLGGVALVRSWLVASVRRSVLYAWTPLILVALAVDSMFESFTLMGVGWFMLVLCALRAGQSRSWRESIDAATTGLIPTLGPENPTTRR